MAITHVGTQSTPYGAATSVAVSLPAGATAGDIAVAYACQDSGLSDVFALPSGFTQINRTTFGGGSWITGYRVIQSGDPSSFSFAVDDSEDGVAAISVFRGVDGSAPMDVTPATSTGNSFTPTTASITTVTDDCAIVAIAGHESQEATPFTPPPGMTELMQGSAGSGNPGASLTAAWEVQATAGSTGTKQFNSSNEEEWGTTILALQPGVATHTGSGSVQAGESTVSATASFPNTGTLPAERASVSGRGYNIAPSTTGGTFSDAITTGTTWTVPASWNSTDNKIRVIGAGGGGALGGGGGGGGAYAEIINKALTPESSISIQIGAAGSQGTAGGDTWFEATSTVLAKGGGGASGDTAGAGGSAASSVGTTKRDGGTGGTGGANGGGGGGAAGDVAAGGNSPGQNGGNGNPPDGGLGATTAGAAGGDGTELNGTVGSGGGGAGGNEGAFGESGAPGGAGGSYGAGGGGGGDAGFFGTGSGAGGPGAQGLIYLTWASATTHHGAGDLYSADANAAGTGAIEAGQVSGSGALQASAPTTAGTATRTITSSGALRASASSATGSADRIPTASGALSAGAVSASGVGERKITASIVLVANTATLDGAGGSLNAIVAQRATLSGSASVIRAADGSLVSTGASLAGSATVTRKGVGALQATQGTLQSEGRAFTGIAGSGALSANLAATSGLAGRIVVSTGNMVAGGAQSIGRGARAVTGTSNFVAGAAVAAGTGIRIIIGAGAQQASPAAIVGEGVTITPQSGEIVAGPAAVAGVGRVIKVHYVDMALEAGRADVVATTLRTANAAGGMKSNAATVNVSTWVELHATADDWVESDAEAHTWGQQLPSGGSWRTQRADWGKDL